jgi:hypothetical protein
MADAITLESAGASSRSKNNEAQGEESVFEVAEGGEQCHGHSSRG